MKLREALAAGQLKNVRVVAISPDAQDKLAAMADQVAAKTGKEFTGVDLLGDPNHVAIDAWGLLNEAAAQRGRIIPHPATYVLDAKGIIRWRYLETDYKVRPTNEQVIAAIERIRAAR